MKYLKNKNWYALPSKSLAGLERITKFANRFQCETKFTSTKGEKLRTILPEDLSSIRNLLRE